MTTRKPTARERQEARIAEHAEAMLSDTRYSRLRTRGARVALVVASCAMLVLLPLAWILGGSIVGLATDLVSFVLWGALRVSVRVVADLPDSVLDERQVRVRDAGYLEAYRWFAGLIVAAASVGLVAFVIASGEFNAVTLELRYETVMGIFWTVEFAALALPSMVLALRERELPADA